MTPSKITVNLETIPKPKRGRPSKTTETQRLERFHCHISNETMEAIRITAERLQVSQGALIEAFGRSLAGQIAA